MTTDWCALPAIRDPQFSILAPLRSLDETIRKIEQGGGKICIPKMAIPKLGWLAYAEDPQGNVFGLTEPDPNAK